jgi:hypothetical protein
LGYAHFTLLDKISHIDSLSCPHVSDHDPVLMRYGESDSPEYFSKVIFRMSRSLIKQLGIVGSKVHKYTLETLAKFAHLDPPNSDDDNPNFRWDCCKSQLMAFYMECDKRNGQRLRDKKANAVKLSKWGDADELPDSMSQFEDAFAARQAGERDLKEIAMRDYENARIRSKFNWLREGEHSNKLFFNSIQSAHKQMHIPNVKANGVKSTNHKEKRRTNSTVIQRDFL